MLFWACSTNKPEGYRGECVPPGLYLIPFRFWNKPNALGQIHVSNVLVVSVQTGEVVTRLHGEMHDGLCVMSQRACLELGNTFCS